LTDRTVALVVKEAAASEGVHERVFMAQTRHKGTS